ncbi:MAG: hypothetical protein JW940_20535 [Polyangiaceae bacterium]|nr:hypothetical protein [Polyangiaceae bacterium]
MKTMAALGGRGHVFRMIALGLVIGACGGTTGAANGGESHFLRACDGACGAGLKCISGVCTRACVLGKDSCADLATNAECTDQSIEPGAVVICDVGCSRDSDCSSLGEGYECQAGFCRGKALSSGAAGGEGNAGGSPGATGGQSNAGGSVDATGGQSNTGGSANRGGSSSGAEGGAGNDSAGGAAGVDGSCRVLHQTYPSGTTDIPDPAGCGTCECHDWELSCQEPGCEIGPLVFPCPDDIVSDLVDVDYYSIQGDKLVLDARYSGGCKSHDFGVCYEETFRESNPVQGTLRLLHDAHDDTCKAIVSSNLVFDLRPYADYYHDLYPADGGLISTNYGLYAFGTLTCDERTQAASAQMDSVVAQLSLTCSSADDCEWAENVTACSDRCGVLIARSQEDRLKQGLDAISASTCAGFEEDGCTLIVPPCIVPTALDCIDGQCAVASAVQ